MVLEYVWLRIQVGGLHEVHKPLPQGSLKLHRHTLYYAIALSLLFPTIQFLVRSDQKLNSGKD